jgi:hypothetical protein
MIVQSSERLRVAAAHWIALDQCIDDGNTSPPIDIVGTCTICLSSIAAISRLLFVGDRKGKKTIKIPKRCSALMSLLGNPSLIAVQKLSVRNSWEHLDERLDEVLSSPTYNDNGYSEIHVSVKPPDQRTFVNRHFDPVNFEIKHGPDSVALQPLIEECLSLIDRVTNAYKLLEHELHNPY